MFFYKDGFGIELPMKVDMPLNKETKEPSYPPRYRLNSITAVLLQG